MDCVSAGNIFKSHCFQHLEAVATYAAAIQNASHQPYPTPAAKSNKVLPHPCRSTPITMPAAAAATSKAANAPASSTSCSASTTPSPSPPRKPISCPSTWRMRILARSIQEHTARPMHTRPTRMALAVATIESIVLAMIARTMCIVARGRCTTIIGRRNGFGSSSIGGGLAGSGVGLGFEGEARRCNHLDGDVAVR